MAEEEQEPQIKTIEEYHQRAPRRWPLLVGYILAALIIAVVIVFGARAIYHHYHNHKPTVKTAPAATTTVRPGTTSSGSSSASSPTSGSQTANGNLPNSGPGQVVALFAISSAAAAGGHFLIKLQRQKKSL